MTLRIVSMGHCHPTNVITNKFLEDLDIGSSGQWIEEKIGILERVTSLPLDYIKTTRNRDPRMAKEAATTSSVKMAVDATKMALQRAGLSASDLGMVIVNCCTPETSTPSVAQNIARMLDISVVAYDVFTACPAFALHVDFLSNFDESKLPDYVLCVSTASITHHVNYDDRTDGAIWGDGAAVWIMSTRKPGRLEIVDSTFMADPSRCEAVVVDKFGYFRQDGRAVRDFSVRQTVRLIKAIEETHAIDWNKDIFVGHQANRTMLEQITNNREIPADRHWHNVTYLGNQAGAGAPAVLSMHWDQLVSSGQRVVSAVVGAGLSWGSVVMRVI